MKLFGITGGVGMGKSTSGALAGKAGDGEWRTRTAIARQLVEPGQPALAEIARVFGPRLSSRRMAAWIAKELARRVFADAAERAKLEAILHPKIREVWEAEVKWLGAYPVVPGAR